jgi:homoserine kinase
VKIEFPDIPIVICVIKKAQRTTRGLIPNHLSLRETKEQMSYCAFLIHAILSGDLKKIGNAVNRDHISEPVRSKFISHYIDIKKKVLEEGAYGCNVSGGGSSIFAICEKEKTGKIAKIMKTHFNLQGVENEVIETKASNTGIVEVDEL